MQTSNRILDDLARVANGAVSAVSGVKAEVEALVRQQVERLMGDMDAVPREEFNAVKAMAAKARAEQEKLESRVTKLEALLEAQLADGGKKSKERAAKAAKPRQTK